MHNVLLVGNFGAKNKGDELILQGMLALCRKLSLSPCVVSQNPRETGDLYSVPLVYRLPFGLRSFFRFSFFGTLCAYMKSGMVFLGGGGLFVDRIKRAPLLWFLHGFIALFLRKPLFLIGHSFEIQAPFSRKLVRYLCMRARYISVRDAASMTILKDMGIQQDKCFLFPDISFLASVQESSGDRLNIFGVSLCKWGMSSESLQEILDFLVFVLDSGYSKIRLFPFQSGNDDDVLILRRIFEGLPPGAVEMVSYDDASFFGKLSECSCLLGMRLHSLLASYSLKIPFIALAYQHKVVHSMSDLGLERYIHGVNAFSSQDLIESFRAVLEDSHFFERFQDVLQDSRNQIDKLRSFLP